MIAGRPYDLATPDGMHRRRWTADPGSVSVNLDNVGGAGTYELGVDHDFYGKLGRQG